MIVPSTRSLARNETVEKYIVMLSGCHEADVGDVGDVT